MYVQVTSNHTYSLFFNRPEHGPFTGEIAVHDIGMYVCMYLYVCMSALSVHSLLSHRTRVPQRPVHRILVHR